MAKAQAQRQGFWTNSRIPDVARLNRVRAALRKAGIIVDAASNAAATVSDLIAARGKARG